MKLTFFGAAHAVTGSCHCVECGGKKVLVDCGLQQGRDERDGQALDFFPGDMEAVVVTHAHIDHSGRIPLLVKQGFQGNIYCTRLTGQLLTPPTSRRATPSGRTRRAGGPATTRWNLSTPWRTRRRPSSTSSPANTAPPCRLPTG